MVVLGAGFGGLELSTILSEALGERLDLTLIDKNDSFIFGFSKLDVMFGRKTPEAVRLSYRNIVKPGVSFRQETITAIDPDSTRVTTDSGTYEADVLVVALGADYDPDATPGLIEGGNEFYSVAGAERLREVLPTFSQGPRDCRRDLNAVQVPAGAERSRLVAARLSHHARCARRLRDQPGHAVRHSRSRRRPIPRRRCSAPSPSGASPSSPTGWCALLDPARRVAILDDGSEMPYDLFLGIPKHRVPDVVAASGMTVDGWIPVNPKNLKTRFPGVYAIGDVTSVGTPKAGVFAEGAARVVAASLIAELRAKKRPRLTTGRVPATSSLGESASGGWMWTSFPGRRPQAVSPQPLLPWSRRSSTLAPAAGGAGLGCDEDVVKCNRPAKPSGLTGSSFHPLVFSQQNAIIARVGDNCRSCGWLCQPRRATSIRLSSS